MSEKPKAVHNVKNAAILPKVYYGMHMEPGLAEYQEAAVNNGKPYRIFLNEDTIKKMDPTFQGKPVYVKHVDEVDLGNLQATADGYVVESFYNAIDGKHWVKFIVVSDKGHESIRNGWRLSNAYIPKIMGGGGVWHAIDYLKEVKQAEYEHLAIVPNPRYEASRILTPEQFKTYNNEKELELKKLSNAKPSEEKKPMGMSFFKKTKVDNELDLENTLVMLPQSKKEMTIAEAIKNADSNLMTGCYANGDSMVKVGDEEMTVNQLMNKYSEMKKSNEDKDAADKKDKEEKEKKENEAKAKEEEEKKNKKQNDKPADPAVPPPVDPAAKKPGEPDFFTALQNADQTIVQPQAVPVEMMANQVQRGQDRYGSGK